MARNNSKNRDTHGHGPSQRQLRVGEEVRHALAQVFARGGMRDPDLQDSNAITVTEVRISPDLRNATAFVMPLGGTGSEVFLAALKRSAPYLKSQVAREVPLKFVPSLSFELDRSFDYATRIDVLLHKPEVARDLDPQPPRLSLPDQDVPPDEKA